MYRLVFLIKDRLLLLLLLLGWPNWRIRIASVIQSYFPICATLSAFMTSLSSLVNSVLVGPD